MLRENSNRRGNPMFKIISLICALLFSYNSYAHISIEKIKEARSDKRVVNLRSNQYLYTLTPVNLLKEHDLKVEALQQFQTFVTSMTKDWHVQIAKVLKPELSKYSPSELEQMSFEEFNQKLESGEIDLTAYEIIENTLKSKDKRKATKDVNKEIAEIDKFLDDYNTLINSLAEEAEVYGNPDAAWYQQLKQYLWEQKVPDAFIVKAGGKFPDSLTQWFNRNPYKPIKALAPLTLGGVHISLIAKYWRSVETNLNTGKTRVFWYRESGWQIWYAKDLKGDGLQKISNNFRFGLGFIWGDVEKVEDYSGGYAGISKSFSNCPVGNLVNFLKIPLLKSMKNCNVKVGAIGPGISDIFANRVERPPIYAIASLEGGIVPTAMNKAHINLGSVTQFSDIEKAYQVVTAEELQKEASSREVPEESDKPDEDVDRVLRPNAANEITETKE